MHRIANRCLIFRGFRTGCVAVRVPAGREMATFLERAPRVAWIVGGRNVAGGPLVVIVQRLGVVLAGDVVVVAEPCIDDVGGERFA
ncbi:MAG: hypothetical protein CMJ58_15520 [Planctomycetaceae bacterium]|nr:hypothetical protein [Planctomycetaceae bacterium]